MKNTIKFILKVALFAIAGEVCSQTIILSQTAYIERCSLFNDSPSSHNRQIFPITSELRCVAKKAERNGKYYVECEYFDGVQRGLDINKTTGSRNAEKSLIIGHGFEEDYSVGRLDVKQATKIVYETKSVAKNEACSGQAAFEPYPIGASFSSYRWGKKEEYGYSGTIVEVIEPRKRYMVRVEHIDTGSWKALNPEKCSGESALEYPRDIGKIITIPSGCFRAPSR